MVLVPTFHNCKKRMRYFSLFFVFVSGYCWAQEDTNLNLWEASIATQYSTGKIPRGVGVSSSSGVTETETPKFGWSFAIRRHLNPLSKVILEPGVALSCYSFHNKSNYPSTYTFLPRIASEDLTYLFATLDNRILVSAINHKKFSILPFAGIAMNVLLDSKKRG